MMIRQCTADDFQSIYRVINSAAAAYKGVIPPDRYHEPYMSGHELQEEIKDGVVFYGYEEREALIGVMGIQDRGAVTLVRHSYVLPRHQRCGIGSRLLQFLRGQTAKPVLIGTWADAVWAVAFYQKHGFILTDQDTKNRLLQKYWRIPRRQIETSVVLADDRFLCTQAGG